MKKSSWLNLFLLFSLLLSISATTNAATCNSLSGTLAVPSNFNTTGTWSCGAVPGNNDQINISHYVTRTGNQTFQWGTQVITINAGGYLKIVGDLTLKGGGTKFVINNGGTLEVTGTLLMETGGVTFDVESGGTLKAGTLQNNAGSTITIKTGGTANLTTLNVGNDASATFNNNGTTNVTGNASIQGKATNTGSMDVDLDFTVTSSGNASFTTSGSLNVDGNASSGKTFQVNPNGYVYIKGNFTTVSNECLTVGTDVAPTPYANMVIKGDLLSATSGDVRVKDNGRLAVFGDFERTTNNGGIAFTIEDKGQVFIHGNINLSAGAGGGGNTVDNQNTADPYGLYYNGTASNVAVDSNSANSTVMQSTNPTFYNWIATQPGNPFAAMPITLQYLRIGDKQSDGILIEWATAIEKNFDRFEVEFSKDGQTFETLTTVKGAGESTTLLRYDFEHHSPVSGKNYYRLKSVDRDNTFEYSGVVVAYWNGAINGVSVYPNPVENRIINVNQGDSARPIKHVAIFDQTGTMLWEGSGSPFLEIELPGTISSGTYILTIRDTYETRVIRLIVR